MFQPPPVEPTISIPATIALGLFGGVGATVAWELFLRPSRARRALAEVLFVENGHNIQILAATILHQSLPVIPHDFFVHMTVYEALLSDLALLPPRVVLDVSHLYARYHSLNRIRDSYSASITERRQLGSNPSLDQQIHGDLLQMRVTFHTQVESTIEYASALQKKLEVQAFPWWSSRSWLRLRSTALTPAEMKSRLEDSQARQSAMRGKLGG